MINMVKDQSSPFSMDDSPIGLEYPTLGGE